MCFDPAEFSYPPLNEFRMMLGLSIEDFCNALDIPIGKYVRWVGYGGTPTLEEQKFLATIWRRVKEHGSLLLTDRI